MSYSSASEGEIMESEGEKATKTRPSNRDMAIDRKSRPRSPLSRSPRPPQLDGASDHYSTHNRPTRAHDLDYGHHHHTNSHGQKRRHEDDASHSRNYDDPRRFQVRYEPREGHEDRRRNDYRSDRSDQSRPARHGRYDDRAPPGKRHQSERHRARSRSPTRFNSDHITTQAHERPIEHGSRSRRSSTYSTADRESPPLASKLPESRVETSSSSSAARQHGASHVEHGDPVVVDEAKLIEERRKRREALRAKHRGQNTSLLHKALETNAAAQPATVPVLGQQYIDSSEAPSTDVSPSTSQPATPASPATFYVSNDEELANPAQASPNSQRESSGSAAVDYDAAMDIQQIRLREQRADRGVGAVDYDETKDQDRAGLSTQASSASASRARETKEFDMFAEEDDDDMFAPEADTGHKKDDGTQAVRIPEAKQLDRGLLDDWDDPEGYYRIILGELLDGRYHVQTNLGKGVFSAVVRALDTKTDRLVAIKVIRKQESMYRAGMKEIETLQTLAEADPDDKKHLIRLERHFEHKGHLCMVFENLSINLREVLKKFGRDIGINIKAVRSYAQQMFLGLSLLRKCEILHADLKPDNVLVNDNRSQLKIADLGSAVSASDNEVTDVLVSRFYRAPEIMLGIRHDYAIDMWSIGCTLFELYTGKICFTGPTNNQMLRVIMECRGRIPNRMLKKAEFWAQHFDPDGTFLSHEIDNVARKEFVRRQNITRPDPSKELKARLFANAKGLSPVDAKELMSFADLLDRCLALDPARRITPTDALKHGFITRAGLQGR